MVNIYTTLLWVYLGIFGGYFIYSGSETAAGMLYEINKYPCVVKPESVSTQTTVFFIMIIE